MTEGGEIMKKDGSSFDMVSLTGNRLKKPNESSNT